MRTRRSRAVEMSGNRRQPSRRGQVGQGPARPLGMARHSWTATSGTLRQALLQEVVCFWQPQEGVARSPLALWTSQAPWHPSASLPVSLAPLQTREKEKMKEAKDARYTNGHLFTTISVSGMTMCYACNKSITAKEALICPSKFFGP